MKFVNLSVCETYCSWVRVVVFPQIWLNLWPCLCKKMTLTERKKSSKLRYEQIYDTCQKLDSGFLQHLLEMQFFKCFPGEVFRCFPRKRCFRKLHRFGASPGSSSRFGICWTPAGPGLGFLGLRMVSNHVTNRDVSNKMVGKLPPNHPIQK